MKQAEYKNDKAEAEFIMTQSLASSSVQLVELKLLNIKFSSDMGSLNWLAESVEHVKATLKVFIIQECGVKGSIPPKSGMLRQLVVLDLRNNQFAGTIPYRLVFWMF